MSKDSILKRIGVSGYNKPKRTPNHPTKSHVVVARSGDKIKTIRFGQQGVSGSPKKQGESDSYRKRRESFKARHASNISKGKMSAAYWADKVKWTIFPIGIMLILSSGEEAHAKFQFESGSCLSTVQVEEIGPW